MTSLRFALFTVVVAVAGCAANQANPGPEPAPGPAAPGPASPGPASPGPASPGPGSPGEPSNSGGAVGDTCGTRGAQPCGAGLFCNYVPADACGATDAPGHCAGKPRACPRIVQPVCGCDGKTYTNGCEAMSASVGMKATGACPK
jgi:hypothetical protein